MVSRGPGGCYFAIRSVLQRGCASVAPPTGVTIVAMLKPTMRMLLAIVLGTGVMGAASGCGGQKPASTVGGHGGPGSGGVGSGSGGGTGGAVSAGTGGAVGTGSGGGTETAAATGLQFNGSIAFTRVAR